MRNIGRIIWDFRFFYEDYHLNFLSRYTMIYYLVGSFQGSMLFFKIFK